MSIYSYAFTATAPIGGLLTGWLVAFGGTEMAFLVAGCSSLLTLLGGLYLYHYAILKSPLKPKEIASQLTVKVKTALVYLTP